MDFIVMSHSIYDDEKQPCTGAVRENIIRTDERIVDDPMKLICRDHESWYFEGKNHRVEKSHIKRDFDKEAWVVRIESIEELLTFIKNNDGHIEIHHPTNLSLPTICVGDER